MTKTKASPSTHLRAGAWIRPEKRAALYEADKRRCTYCGKNLGDADPDEITLDHIDPRGGNESANLTTACAACNVQKGGKNVFDFIRDESKNPSVNLMQKLQRAKNKKKPHKPAKKPKVRGRISKAAKTALGGGLGMFGKSRVNPKGTAAARRKKIPGKPRSRRSLAAKPDPNPRPTINRNNAIATLL